MAVKKDIKSTQDPGKIDLKDPVVEIPPQSKWTWVKNHLKIHRPFYVWLPIAVIGVWAAFHGYAALTGRAPVDELPIGALGNLLIAVVVVVLTNNTKGRLFDDIDTRDPAVPWWRVLIDSWETIFLLLFFGYLLTH